MPDMNPILARFQHEPALLTAGSTAWFESCVEKAAAFADQVGSAADAPKMADDFWYAAEDWRAAYRPYNVSNGVLTIPVQGVLLNGYPWAASYATGYEYIWKAFDRGMSDPSVRAIALQIDSPGGMVAGNFDLVDRMFAARGRKPVKAFASESAYSAAYSIASAADDITVTRSGGVGSVGVVTMHVDMSAMLEKVGVKVTFIFAGKHKVDGNAYEALPADVREKIQSRIDATYKEFVGLVARNRGMKEADVRKTEAATFSASEALDVGFADKIGAFDIEISAFQATFTNEDTDMAEKALTESDLAEATTKGKAEGRTEGYAEGFKAANDRFKAILGCDAAKIRPKAALHAALNTSMPSEEASAFLDGLPEEKAEAAASVGGGAPKGMFEAAMGATQPADPAQGQAEAKGADDRRAARLDLITNFGLSGFAAPAKN